MIVLIDVSLSHLFCLPPLSFLSVGGNCPPRTPMGPEPLVCAVRGRREHKEQIEANTRAVLPRFGPRWTRKTLLLLGRVLSLGAWELEEAATPSARVI